MNQDKLNKIAKGIIGENLYLTLATTDDIPWAAPLFYCTDDKYNFYFISQMHSRHTQHLLKNPTVAFAIFDSHQEEGTGNGVQGLGKAYKVAGEDLEEALNWYQTTFIEMTTEALTGNAPYRMFKLVPEKFYVLDPEAEVDRRVEVQIT